MARPWRSALRPARQAAAPCRSPEPCLYPKPCRSLRTKEYAGQYAARVAHSLIRCSGSAPVRSLKPISERYLCFDSHSTHSLVRCSDSAFPGTLLWHRIPWYAARAAHSLVRCSGCVGQRIPWYAARAAHSLVHCSGSAFPGTLLGQRIPCHRRNLRLSGCCL